MPDWTALELAAEREASWRDVFVGQDARRAHGVVHTPKEIARFIASSVLSRLKTLEVDLDDVTVIDPACGPGTFFAAWRALGGGGHLVGVDLDPDAITRAARLMPDATWRVGDALAKIPRHKGPVVVLGNPPWSGRSFSRGAEELLADFRRDHQGRAIAGKVGVLSDDYVRFVRWSAEVARRAPLGVVGLVTNSSYLDGVPHRGMRSALRSWFGALDIVDLGGSALVARARRDDNLFGVRPGAAVLFADTRSSRQPTRYAKVRGRAADKLVALDSLAFETVDDERVDGEDACFVPITRAWPSSWVSVLDAMPFHAEGVQTNRDDFAIDSSRDVLLDRLKSFVNGEVSLAAKSHFDPQAARRKLAAHLDAGEDIVTPIAYRPFDPRYVCSISPACHRPRPRLQRAMEKSPFALVTVGKDRGDKPFAHYGLVTSAPDSSYLSSRSSCRTRALPFVNEKGESNIDAARAGTDSPEAFALWALAWMSTSRYADAFQDVLRLGPPRVPPLAESLAAKLLKHTRVVGTPTPGRETVTLGHRQILVSGKYVKAKAQIDVHIASAFDDCC